MLNEVFISCFFNVKVLLCDFKNEAWIAAKWTYKDNFWNGFNNATPLIFEKSLAFWMLQDLN